jgi:hypothetical protein
MRPILRIFGTAFLIFLLVSGPSGADEPEQRLRQTVEELAGMGSRVTGYPGSVRAAEYLREKLRAAGVTEIHTHRFPVPIPMDEGFLLEAGGEQIRLYGVWPNLVRTSTLPPEGIEGELIYAGDGDPAHIEGVEIAGRIVLLDYASGPSWIDLFNLGARAVILLESEVIHRKEAEQKFLAVPAALPRLYAPAAVAERLLGMAASGEQVRLSGRMSWKAVQGETLVGVIEGRDPELKDEAILIGAHYDAISPVPALAPGADQAGSAAALIELTHVLTARRPRRTIFLVLTAGHFENLAGMRHFAPLMQRAAGRREEMDGDDDPLVERLRGFQIRMFVGMDLSMGSELLGVYKPNAPYRTSLLAPPITARFMGMVAAYEDSALGGRKMLANGLKQDFSRQGLGTVASTLPLDASVASLAGCPALAFATINDSRRQFDAPVSQIEAEDFVRLGKQVDFLGYLIPRLVDDGELEAWEWGNDVFGTIRGEVVHYGPRSYLPDQPTGGALVRVRQRHPTLMGVRPDFWAVADDSGHFEIPGIATRIIYTKPVRIEAYGLDAASGEVTDVPDWGINGERRLPARALTIQMDDHEEEVQIVTTAARGMALIETFDPRNLLTPEKMELINAATEAEPPLYGACLPLTPPEMELFGYHNRVGSWIEPTAVIFVPPGTRVKMVMATGLYGLGRRLLLLNGTPEKREGEGYLVEGEGYLAETPYKVARDIFLLNDKRIGDLRRHGVRNGRLAAFHQRTEELLEEAGAARRELRHQTFLDRARQAWAYAAAAYRDVERTQSGVIQGALFLLAALIPFAHFTERLLFGFADVRRQVIGYFGLFLAGFLALSYLHPAFDLSISPAVILLGFVILALGMLVTSIGISRLNRELKQLAQGRRQGHDVQRAGVMAASVAVGLAHLRRRPMRTGLTCATLVLLTFSVLSFTSIRATLHANWIDVGEEAAYTGALVRMRGWKTMEISAYKMLMARFGKEQVAPRAWMSVTSLASSFRVEREDVEGWATGILGISGLSAQEAMLVHPQEELSAGRWLVEGEMDACLVPTGIADSLGIGAADLGTARVRIFGESFRVVGLLRPEALEKVDLNGEPLTPLDPEAQKPTEAEVGSNQGGQLAVFPHLPGASTVVLPFEAVMRWEQGKLVSVGVLLADGNGTRAQLEALAETLDLNLFVGLDGKRFLVNTVGVSSVSGLGALVVPLGIAALIVLNTMMGAVYERTREIGTFNAVGLAPSHVSGLFMAEAVAVGVIGAVMGYLIGQAAAQLMGKWGFLPGLQLNYSSLSAVLSLGMVLALVVVSAFYPARMAGRICTPGIERRWRPPEPQGHQIEMQLPFTLVRRDALGMTAFQAEFWEEHQEQSIGAGFYVEALQVRRQGDRLMIDARTWLAPFDQGVVQKVALELAPSEEPAYYEINVVLELVSGDFDTWRRVSRTFLDDLRKQFLVWRTLSLEDREAYVAELTRWEIDQPPVEG